MKRGLLILGPATLSRVVWSALFSTVVVLGLSAAEAAFTLQMLFIQGAATALLSASAYARAHQLVGQQRDVRENFHGFTTFVLLMGVAMLMAGALLRTDAVAPAEKWACVAALIVGAGGTALNGFLQGVAAALVGVARAFTPVLVVSVAFCLLSPSVLLWRNPVWALTLWALSQVAVPVAQWASCRELREALGRPAFAAGRSALGYFGAGTANSAQVASVYAYREAWAAHHPSAVAASGFYVSRVAELCFQVAYMAAASAPERIKARLSRTFSSPAGALGYGLLTIAAGALAWIGTGLLGPPRATTFVVAEALTAPLRVLSMAVLIVLLGRLTTRAYVVAMLASAAAVVGLMYLPGVAEMDYGLVRGQVVAGLAMVLTGLALSCWDPEIPSADRTPEVAEA